MFVRHLPFLLALLIMWPGAAMAKVELRFVDPLTYTDGTLRDISSGKSREETYNALHKVFERLAKRHLADHQTLLITITELDLAGEFEPWRVNLHDVRFMRTVTWPRMQFTYEVLERGQIVISGAADLKDMNYLRGSHRYSRGGRMHYERRMLSEWFSKTFSKSNTAQANID